MRQFIVSLALLILLSGVARSGPVSLYESDEDSVRNEIALQLGPQNSFALVIGISTYVNGWTQLPGVDIETREVSDALRQHGFTIVPGANNGRLDANDLHKAIDQFVRQYGSRAENRLIIYVAGHGATLTQDGKKAGFLVASDTPPSDDPSFQARAYSVDDLAQSLQGVASQHIFMFFDSCFSGAMVPDVRRGPVEHETVRRTDALPLSPEVANWTMELLSHNARLILTAGSEGQEVPDKNNPYAKSIIRGLMGEADTDGDGLILGLELVQFVRGYVARETRALRAPNDPVFAVLPKVIAPPEVRPDARDLGRVDYRQQGDFIFLSPLGTRELSGEANITARRNDALPRNQFTDCADCPIMAEIPEQRIAFATTETTLASWDACYRELLCHHWIDDQQKGRGDRPAQGIDWAEAQAFIRWLNRKSGPHCAAYRLPTSEEWRAAALAGSQSALPWGDTILPGKAVCWGCDNGMNGWTAERTASHPANTFGLADMVGNLWEWTADGEQDCPPADQLGNGRCATPGTVIGGSYATRAISTIPEGQFPRGIGLSLPTIGLRVVCDLK